ncbi:hypothetical protein EV121DRAFT_285632 [Schizophyllum commune]
MRFFRARSTTLCAKCNDALCSKVASSKLIRISILPHVNLPEIEISALAANLLEVQNDLEACDRAIDRLEATLADLRQHRSSLETTATHLKSICAPIRRLPPDILGEIAAYTLPPRWFDDPSGKHVWTFMQAPVVLKELNTEHLLTEDARDILLRHAYHIRALEVLTGYGQEDLVPCHLPLLQELIFRGPNTGRALDVPNLRILDADSAAPFLNTPWAHIRAVKIQAVKIDDVSISALSQCTNVEVLSFSIGFRPYPPKPQLPHSSSFPALHTLEIGGAAIELCPLIVAPSLRHFTLNMAYNNELWEPGLTLYDASLLDSLLRGCDTITLRNMHAHSVVHLRGVLSIPHKLRKVSFIRESGGGTLGTPYCKNSDFVQALAYSQSDPTFVDLEEVEIINGAHLARWTHQDIDLVCELFCTRAIPSSTSGCPGLKRVLIRAPYAYLVLERLNMCCP